MRARIGIKGWLGLAALGAMQYMGPRPIFVKTAYAEAPAVTVQATVALDAAGEAQARPELAAEAPVSLDSIH